MNTKTIALVSVLALFAAGCVTESGLSLEPQSEEEQARANLSVGIGYLQEGRPDVAIASLERALDIEPRLADAHSAIAVAYDQTEEFELAEQHHRRATQLAPSDPIPQNAFAVFLCRQDRWEDARPFFERAIGNSDGNRPERFMLNAATCARSAGDLEAAEALYRATLDIDPVNPDALRGMVDVSIRTGDHLAGRAFWQRLEQSTAQASSPLLAEDLLSCYIIETGLGDGRAAADCADRLRNQFPGSQALRQQRELEQNGS